MLGLRGPGATGGWVELACFAPGFHRARAPLIDSPESALSSAIQFPVIQFPVIQFSSTPCYPGPVLGPRE